MTTEAVARITVAFHIVPAVFTLSRAEQLACVVIIAGEALRNIRADEFSPVVPLAVRARIEKYIGLRAI
jgi:hypothetical protein